MKNRTLLRVVYILAVFSVFLPWFTYDASIMGYCWGYNFLKWLIVPMVIVAVYLFKAEKNKLLFMLSEVSMLLILAILVIALGGWQEICNIQTGFQWKEGFLTATPTYWLSLVLFLVFFVLFQLKKRDAEKANGQEPG